MKIIFNKSFITNLLALLLVLLGWYSANTYIKSIGLYALSGGLTNWLAVYMLFEKIPCLYGSGIIPNNFKSFKKTIKKMIIDQFFSPKNLNNFLDNDQIKKYISKTIKSNINNDKIFDSFVDMLITTSKYGSMIEMFLGGKDAVEGLRESFIKRLDIKVLELVNGLKIDNRQISKEASQKIEKIIDKRLEELTPEMVKEIVQIIIRKHLGWLVIWGGILGGLIGLITSIFI